MTIQEEISFYENDLGSRFLACKFLLYHIRYTLYQRDLLIKYYLGKSRQSEKTSSIVHFFEEEKKRVPRLYAIVKLLAIVPCSSMPIESVFSIISNKLTRKTNRLSDSTLLNQLITVFYDDFKKTVDQIL